MNEFEISLKDFVLTDKLREKCPGYENDSLKSLLLRGWIVTKIEEDGGSPRRLQDSVLDLHIRLAELCQHI